MELNIVIVDEACSENLTKKKKLYFQLISLSYPTISVLITQQKLLPDTRKIRQTISLCVKHIIKMIIRVELPENELW